MFSLHPFRSSSVLLRLYAARSSLVLDNKLLAVCATPAASPTSASGSSIQCRTVYGRKTNLSQTKVRGIDVLREPKLNKGMAFTIKERITLGIHGLLPPAVISQEEQMHRTLENVKRWDNDLDRYIYVIALQDRNEKLFYKLVTENVEMMAPIIYTPTVGLACQRYGLIYRKPRGLYITINDKGHVYDILCNWPEDHVKAIVVTDGERILGLGDLGAYGMGIPVGKLSLYTALAGIPPQNTLPILMDVGTDNDKLLEDPMYIGLKHKRVRGSRYDSLMDEFMEAVVKRFGHGTLVQFEDFANTNAFRLLEKYRGQYLTFNDDIQGTAAVAVAGILASMKITKQKVSDGRYLFLGAGEAAIGIAHLLIAAMKEEGLTEGQATDRIWMVDSRGLVVKDRSSGGVTGEKIHFAKDYKEIKKFEEAVEDLKPTAIIGVAAIGKSFTEKVLHDMASFNEHPIVFALSNPTSKAECTAEEAYRYTDGRVVFASGSPFDPVTYNGKTYYPGQGNNAYIFPGVALASILAGKRHIGDDFFLKSAQYLAEMVTDDHLAEGRVYPPLAEVRERSTELAARLVDYAYESNMATFYPRPDDTLSWIQEFQYSTEYESFVPQTYTWPGFPE